jgi:hypothetical protein
MGFPLFLSWSGELSREVATVIHKWIPSVLQAAEPFLSAEDIEKGARWSDQIASKLQESGFGIIVLTPENLAAPWILFEAGALSKMVGKPNVAPLLINLQVSQVRSPLNQFQATRFDKIDLLKLLKSINKCCQSPVKEEVLSLTFDALWGVLEKEVENIIETHAKKGSPAEPERVTLDSLGLSLGDLIRSVQSLRDDIRPNRPGRSNIPHGAIRDIIRLTELIGENADGDGDLIVIGDDSKEIVRLAKILGSFLKRRNDDSRRLFLDEEEFSKKSDGEKID